LQPNQPRHHCECRQYRGTIANVASELECLLGRSHLNRVRRGQHCTLPNRRN